MERLIDYDMEKETGLVFTPCPFGEFGAVGSMACDFCKYHIDNDKEVQIVTCGHD